MKGSSELLELFLATFSLLHLEHVEPHCLTEGAALAGHHQVTWLNIPADEREEEEGGRVLECSCTQTLPLGEEKGLVTCEPVPAPDSLTIEMAIRLQY